MLRPSCSSRLSARESVLDRVYQTFLPDLGRRLLVYQPLLPGLVYGLVYQALLFLLSFCLAGLRAPFLRLASFLPRILRLMGLLLLSFVDRLPCQLLLVDRSRQRLVCSGRLVLFGQDLSPSSRFPGGPFSYG